MSLSAIAAANIAAKTPIPNNKPLYNPYEGIPSGRQLTESIPDFLSRLPPLTTPTDKVGPWIWIANPYSSARPLSQDLGAFTTAGTRILESLSPAIADQETALKGRPQSILSRQLTQLRKTATEQLLNAAQEHGVTHGKWMLFPTPEDVNDVWRLVADATVSGQLGSGAKVATDSGLGDGRPRLVCVYTEEFFNDDDVKRVLKKLAVMGLANQKEAAGAPRGIYYKCGKSSPGFRGGVFFMNKKNYYVAPAFPSHLFIHNKLTNSTLAGSDRCLHPPRNRFQERMGPKSKLTRFQGSVGKRRKGREGGQRMIDHEHEHQIDV